MHVRLRVDRSHHVKCIHSTAYTCIENNIGKLPTWFSMRSIMWHCDHVVLLRSDLSCIMWSQCTSVPERQTTDAGRANSARWLRHCACTCKILQINRKYDKFAASAGCANGKSFSASSLPWHPTEGFAPWTSIEGSAPDPRYTLAIAGCLQHSKFRSDATGRPIFAIRNCEQHPYLFAHVVRSVNTTVSGNEFLI